MMASSSVPLSASWTDDHHYIPFFSSVPLRRASGCSLGICSTCPDTFLLQYFAQVVRARPWACHISLVAFALHSAKIRFPTHLPDCLLCVDLRIRTFCSTRIAITSRCVLLAGSNPSSRPSQSVNLDLFVHREDRRDLRNIVCFTCVMCPLQYYPAPAHFAVRVLLSSKYGCRCKHCCALEAASVLTIATTSIGIG
mmetsp:Transcript_15257/g.21618  ORF Transcript_15257/g.21618 Transcript_15257/m.21618 type:complete len:196 (+) Transcript_15257:367-954(+)